MKGQCFFIFILTAEVAWGITMKINTEAIQITPLKNGRVLVGNVMTGDYLKISKAYFEVITSIINQYGELNKFLQESDEEATIKNNLQKLYEGLVRIKYFVQENEKFIEDTKYNEIYLAVTDRCNLKCKHCCQDSGCRVHDALTTDDIKLAINYIIMLNPKGIVFTGGEPIMRKDLIELLHYARTNFKGQIILSTNTLLITEKNINSILENITGISISLDGYDQNSCDIVRGNGVFKRTIENIKLIRKKGFENISISAVYTKYMERHENEFNELCEKYDAVPIIRNLFLNGRANINEDDLVPSDYLWHITRSREISCRHCRAGERELYISSAGEIYPCPNLQYKEFYCGNVTDPMIESSFRERKIGEIAQEKMKIHRTWNQENCKNCEMGLFCQTCEAEYKMLFDNKALYQKFCETKRNYLSSLI